MDVFRFDRLDRIGTEITLGFVWLAAVASLLVEPISRWIQDLPLLLPSNDFTISQVPIDGAGAAERLIMLIVPMLTVILLGVGAWLAMRILRTISSGDPFQRTQVRRLRTVAVLLITTPLVLEMGTSVSAAVVLSRLGETVEASFALPIPWLLAGLLTAAVAQAFADGASMRDDVEGLV